MLKSVAQIEDEKMDDGIQIRLKLASCHATYFNFIEFSLGQDIYTIF